jgi:hypothetical protein
MSKEIAMRTAALCVAAALGLAGLSACDKSPQNADGTTKTGDTGTASATNNGTTADTGHDNATAGADIGGAGQVAEPGGATSAGGATSPKSQ